MSGAKNIPAFEAEFPQIGADVSVPLESSVEVFAREAVETFILDHHIAIGNIHYLDISGEQVPVRNRYIVLGMGLLSAMAGSVVTKKDIIAAICPDAVNKQTAYKHLKNAFPTLTALAGLQRVEGDADNRSGFLVPELSPDEQQERVDVYTLLAVAKASAGSAQHKPNVPEPAKNNPISTEKPVDKARKTKGGSARGDESGNREYEEGEILRSYLHDIGKHSLLSKDEERELGRKIQAGVEAVEELTNSDLSRLRKRELRRIVAEASEARQLFINSNLRLVVSIAKRYLYTGVKFLDLIQEGNLGLMHAVDKFDGEKGFKFSTYATWWVRQAITRGVVNIGRTIRLPVHVEEDLNHLNRARNKFEAKNLRTPTIEELAIELEMPVEKVIELLKHSLDILSLDAEVGREDSDVTLVDFIQKYEPGYALVEQEQSSSSVVGLLSILDEREKYVVKARFGLDTGVGRSNEEIARLLGISSGRIQQIHSKAIAKLRKEYGDNLELTA